MANICTNKITINGGKAVVHQLLVKLSEEQSLDFFGGLDTDPDRLDDESDIEEYFDSKWRFPSEELHRVTDSLDSTEGLYIRVVSDECGMEYLEQNIFRDGKWEEQG